MTDTVQDPLMEFTQELPFAQLRLDIARRIISCCDQFRALLGRDVTGQKFDRLLARNDRIGHANYLERLSSYDGGYTDAFVSLDCLDAPQLCRVRMKLNDSDEWFVLVEPLLPDDPIRELLESRQHQRAVSHNAAEGIAFLDDEACIVEHNPRFLDICEFKSKHGVPLTQSSILGRSLAQIAGNEFSQVVNALQAENVHQRSFDDRVHTDSKTLHVKLTPTFLSRDLFGGYVLSVQDLTESEELNRLRLENARSVGQAEIATSILHNVGNSLNSLAVGHRMLVQQSESPLISQLQQALAMLDCENPSQFLQTELGSKCIPCLNAIATGFERLQTDTKSELAQIQRHIEHIQAIVKKQQQFAKKSQVAESCRPQQLFDDALHICLPSGSSARIQIEKHYLETEVHQLDRHRILEILVNLIKNALEAVQEVAAKGVAEAKVRLETDREDDMVCFKVCDSGVGIRSEVVGKVFQRGFTTKDSGHGFGLHSCACMAGELGGSIACESEGIGKGARFLLRVPRS